MTDVYLDDILPLIGYESKGKFQDKGPASNREPPSLTPEEQAAVDEAIFGAFLDASEASFDRLLEVGMTCHRGVFKFESPIKSQGISMGHEEILLP